MVIRAALASFVAFALCCGLAAQEDSTAANRTETRTEALAFGAKLWVKNRNGAILVSGWDKEEVALVAEIHDSDQRRIDLVVQRAGVDLDIEAQFLQSFLPMPFGFALSPKCRMTLRVPRRLLGYFKTINGAISVATVQGYVRCETINGDITLGDIQGEVLAQTTNGDVDAKGLHARILGGTANGRITLEDVDGRVKMETTNGSITARNLDGLGEGISLESANGPIDLELGRATGDILAVNVNGNIRIKVPGGKVLEQARHRVHVKVPGRGQQIALETTNGNIHVR